MTQNDKSGHNLSQTAAGERGDNTAPAQAQNLPPGQSHSRAEMYALLRKDMEAAAQSLKRIRTAELRNRDIVFTSLHHHLTIGMLAIAFFRLNKYAVPGVDGVTKELYQQNLYENLTNIRNLLINDEYRFTPVRRTYIQKATGGQRPLGICIIEDKIVQGALKLILEAAFDVHFAGFSYGFRPGTRAHDGLDALNIAIKQHPVNYILDADIMGCFDNINHDVLINVLKLKIGDRKILTLVNRMLKAGVLEEGTFYKQNMGVVQGAVISPLLANIFLHHVLDVFFFDWRQWNEPSEGFSFMVRYADDFIIGFEHEEQALRFKKVLEDRLLCAGLRIHPKKSRLIRFGKTARKEQEAKGERKPETFKFLGFEFICGVTLKTRNFKIIMHTIGERIERKISEMSRILRAMVLGGNAEGATQYLNRVLKGYYNYFAVHENTAVLSTFRYRLMRILRKLLNRRSQKGYITWEKFNKEVEPLICSPHVIHPYPEQRFTARQHLLYKLRHTLELYEDVNNLVKA